MGVTKAAEEPGHALSVPPYGSRSIGMSPWADADNYVVSAARRPAGPSGPSTTHGDVCAAATARWQRHRPAASPAG
jgi:hypothetical protein